MSQKSVTQIIYNNWEKITSVLEIELNKDKSNIFSIMAHMTPLLDAAIQTISRPRTAVYYSPKDKSHIPLLDNLVRIGFLQKENSSYSCSEEGIKLLNAWHIKRNPNFITSDEITKEILKNTKSF